MKQFNIKSLLALVLLLFLVSCKKDKESVILVEQVTMNHSTKDLYVGESFQLEATILPANATDKTLIWLSSNKNVTVSSSGKIKAEKEGTATITATAKDNGETKATCKVTVKAKAEEGGEGGSGEGENPVAKNYKESYTKFDYYQWDAYAPVDKEDSGIWEQNSSHFGNAKNKTASQSCKDCCDLETAKKYLSEDVYWDEEGPAYTVDGSTTSYTTGLWVMKKEFIPKNAVGKEETTPKKLSEEDAELVKSIRSGKKYFFLPAAGWYVCTIGFYSKGTIGDYWLSTSDGLDAYYLGFGGGVVSVVSVSPSEGKLLLFAE